MSAGRSRRTTSAAWVDVHDSSWSKGGVHLARVRQPPLAHAGQVERTLQLLRAVRKPGRRDDERIEPGRPLGLDDVAAANRVAGLTIGKRGLVQVHDAQARRGFERFGFAKVGHPVRGRCRAAFPTGSARVARGPACRRAMRRWLTASSSRVTAPVRRDARDSTPSANRLSGDSAMAASDHWVAPRSSPRRKVSTARIDREVRWSAASRVRGRARRTMPTSRERAGSARER